MPVSVVLLSERKTAQLDDGRGLLDFDSSQAAEADIRRFVSMSHVSAVVRFSPYIGCCCSK